MSRENEPGDSRYRYQPIFDKLILKIKFTNAGVCSIREYVVIVPTGRVQCQKW